MLVAYGAGEAWGGVSVDYDLTDAVQTYENHEPN
jgi:hypothetical protein